MLEVIRVNPSHPYKSMVYSYLSNLIGRQIGIDHALGAREHIDARRAAREYMLGHRHKPAGLLDIHMLANANHMIFDVDHIVRIFAVLATFATPRGGRTALANNRALAQIGPYIQGRSNIRDMDMSA